MRLSSHLRIAFALFLGILLISNFTTLSSADVQVNASVTNVAPVISTISDHTPNITSALNTESNPSSPMSGTGTVTFNVSWTDANGDSGRLFVCNGAMNSGNTSCASETYCSNSTYHASGTTISCVNVTNSGMPYTNNYNVFIVDNQTSPLASTASAGTFFVGSGAGISGVLLEELGGDGGSFEIGDSINCSATLSDSAGTAPNVTVRIMGPMGTLDDPDFTLQYTSYNLAGCESFRAAIQNVAGCIQRATSDMEVVFSYRGSGVFLVILHGSPATEILSGPENLGELIGLELKEHVDDDRIEVLVGKSISMRVLSRSSAHGVLQKAVTAVQQLEAEMRKNDDYASSFDVDKAGKPSPGAQKRVYERVLHELFGDESYLNPR